MEVLEALDGRLSVRHEGRIIASQEAPPSPVFLRNDHGASASVPVPTSAAHGLGERWTAALEPLDSRAEGENGRITCAEARAHGIAPVHRGHPAYQYMNDADGDGVVCE